MPFASKVRLLEYEHDMHPCCPLPWHHLEGWCWFSSPTLTAIAADNVRGQTDRSINSIAERQELRNGDPERRHFRARNPQIPCIPSFCKLAKARNMSNQIVPDFKQAVTAEAVSVTFMYDATEGRLVTLLTRPRGPVTVLKFSDDDSLEIVLRDIVHAIYPRGYPDARRFQPVRTN